MINQLFSLFNEILSYTGRINYYDFLKALLMAYKYIEPTYPLMNLVNKLSGLMNLLERASAELNSEIIEYYKDTLSVIDSREVYPLLVDNLGLAEIVEISKRFSLVLSFFIINEEATTHYWKTLFKVSTLREFARIFGAQLLNFPDKTIDNISVNIDNSEGFSTPDELSSFLYNRVAMRLINILSGVSSKQMLLISDHGYDIIYYKSKYIPCHGNLCKKFGGKLVLSKIAPIIIIRRN